MKKTKKALLSMLLSAAMVIAMLPGMSMVVKADSNVNVTAESLEYSAGDIIPAETSFTVAEGVTLTLSSFIGNAADPVEVVDIKTGGDKGNWVKLQRDAEVKAYSYADSVHTLSVVYEDISGGSGSGSGSGNEGGSQADSTEYSIDCDINCTANKSKAIAGDPVEITAVADSEGKSFAQWSIRKYTDNGVDDDPDVTDSLVYLLDSNKNTSPATFKMPAYNIYVKAGFSSGGSGSTPQQYYTISKAEGCTVTANSESVTSAAEGTQITITAADMPADSNMRFDHWEIADNDTGTNITSILGNTAKNSSTTFFMPAKNIYVMPVFASESHETTEMPTGGLFAGKFGKYQVFDVSRSPAYPDGTQENPSEFTVSNFKAPFGVGTSITEDGWFYFKPSADQDITYNSSWGVDGAYIVELWYNDNHGYDEKVNSGVIGGIADEGFFYEGDSRYGYYFSNNAGYEYGFSGLTYTPAVRVVCDVDVLTSYTAGSMLVPEGDNTDEEYNANESTAEINISGETAVKNETPVVPGLDAEATSEGEDVSLNLQIAVEPEATLEASPTLNSEPDIKEKVKNQFKDESTVKVDVLNINLRKLVAGIFKENVASTNSVLEIGIGYDFAGKYDPSLVSKHGDDVRTFATLTARPSAGNYRNGTFFPDVANGKFYIYSSDFSEFVISYSTVEGNAQNRSVIDPNASAGSSSASVATNTAPKATPVYRLFNLQKGYHFFTTNLAEKEALVAAGWTDEGVAWYTPTNAGKPVYRLFDKTKGGHIFTTDAALKDACIAAGSTDEGIAWYGLDTGRTVYKITNPKLGRGLYTVNPAEKDALAALGFTVEEADFKVN